MVWSVIAGRNEIVNLFTHDKGGYHAEDWGDRDMENWGDKPGRLHFGASDPLAYPIHGNTRLVPS